MEIPFLLEDEGRREGEGGGGGGGRTDVGQLSTTVVPTLGDLISHFAPG